MSTVEGIIAANLVPLGAGIFVMVGIPYIFHHFFPASVLQAGAERNKELLVSRETLQDSDAILFSKTQYLRQGLSKVREGMERLKEEFREMDRLAANQDVDGWESGSFWKAGALISGLESSLINIEVELGYEYDDDDDNDDDDDGDDNDDESDSFVEVSESDGEEDEERRQGGDAEGTRDKWAHVEERCENERGKLPEELPGSWRMWLDAVGQGIRHRDIDDISSDTSEGPPYTSEV
jgi:hypothetical protein